MGEEKLSATALALLYLMAKRRVSKKELAQKLGHANDTVLGRYLRGDKPLSRERLEELVEPLKPLPEAIDALLFVHDLIEPEKEPEPASPVALTAKERTRIHRTAIAVGWSVADAVRGELAQARREEKAAEARREAEELWERMKALRPFERRPVVLDLPEFRSWALAEKICHESERAAARSAVEAMDLAELALFIAERVPEEKSWRSRIQGYCWAFLANARRVSNDFDGADKAFACMRDLWEESSFADSTLLAEWRFLDLEASLRREQHRFSEALELLGRAQCASGDNATAAVRILLKQEHVLQQSGNFNGALAVLAEAAPFLEGLREPRLIFAHRFNMADNLYHLGRYLDAAALLPEVRSLAIEQSNELDLIRTQWLSGRIRAGLGQKEEAMRDLEQVQREFTVRELPYDAALSSLDLVTLWLEQGRTVEVRTLAVRMSWIFKAQGIHREALAALSLFREAALREAATLELVRLVIVKVEAVMRSASPPG